MKYKIIYADPPWKYNDSGSEKSIDDHYKTMDTEDLIRLPVKDIADDDCALFMWVTFPKLQDGLRVMKEWGFEYKTVAFNFVKLNKDKLKPYMGMGMWTRSNSEICLLGVKGIPVRINADVQQVILSAKGEHSSKPHEAYVRIERLMGDLPRVELFARHRRSGWDALGNEVPNEVQKTIGEGSQTSSGVLVWTTKN